MSVFLRDGKDTFAPRVDYIVGQEPRSIAALDLNGDNKPDLAVANWIDMSVSVLFTTCLP